MERRETQFGRINRAISLLYVALGAAMIVYFAVQRDGYHFGISCGVPLVPLALSGIYRLFRWKPVQQLNFLVLAFTFLAYPLGCCVDFYRILPGFDKLAHMLSGSLVGLLALAMYYALKPGHKIGRRDCALALTFLFVGSMAVAGLWEICEYFLNMISGRDVQRVLATGVADTMQDMIVCMIGTIAVMPFAAAMCRGRSNIITGGVEAFAQINLREEAERIG